MTADAFSTGPAAPLPTTDAPRKLYRSRDDHWLGGVCGGIAQYFGWDATLVRVAFVASILLPGPQVLLYALLWIIIPQAPVTPVAAIPADLTSIDLNKDNPTTFPPA